MTEDAYLSTRDLRDLTVYDPDGEKVGKVSQVWLDDRSGRPEWVSISTGLFGTKESFVPLLGAHRNQEGLQVAYRKDLVKDAPRVEADGHLDQTEEQALYRHYSLQGSKGGDSLRSDKGTAGTTGAAGTAGMAGAAGAAGAVGGAAGQRRSADAATAGMAARGTEGMENGDMIRSEERLRVGKTESEVGHARLRKVVVTENVTTTIPISHEEVRVVREPIKEGETGIRARIHEEEREVTLHAERPVVRKEAVAVERVHLETERITEQQEISDTVRKERVEFDEPGGGRDQGRQDRRGGGRGPSH
ncbi:MULTISPECIES: PRC and DUF2382 domain-containing protein [Streptomyces]|uniref:PRC and DUF2382 domain-containing protein n=3 Tax=Streptomyces TaxID=1883 RepID=A0ABD5EWW0_9ACTN|nr:PRC and DUF2382 domain-containing protein [Streptomyces sp. DSM 41981]MDT0439138.1 PRC and DUF2382 domain-containing protein [Streptomyces sp. DSM 41981]